MVTAHDKGAHWNKAFNESGIVNFRAKSFVFIAQGIPSTYNKDLQVSWLLACWKADLMAGIFVTK